MKKPKLFNKHSNKMTKHLRNIFGTLVVTTLLFTSCDKKESIDNDCDGNCNPATAESFNNLREKALDKLTQNFQFDAEDTNVVFTSQKGVKISINTSCLTLNGEPVTGPVDLEYVEIFEKGNMLATNKPTMGLKPNGDKALLLTGGEFFVEATQNGTALETTCSFQMEIPADLTGGVDPEMILWDGIIDDDGNLVWDEQERDAANGKGGVFGEGNQYFGFFQSFGWTNVDRFYNDSREKTTILVGVPTGYNNANSAVYISYDGEETGLAQLDTYDETTGLFSEHYGQIPIGLECHIIFATEENNNWKYAIKAVTIVENDIITFTEAETELATEAQLATLINGLP
ncbi:hypothetical protein ACFFU9_04290 [Mariniflexile ostreae]|uniref:Lipoprotein n=1 Tax=Mariniflexile ostreae TaxID=1520892 RepID=A0ABV5F935_9FLAO